VQSPRFRINRHVLILLVVILAALVLPLGAVFFALIPRGASPAQISEPEGLRERLEQLAGQKLAAGLPEASGMEWRIMVPELARTARHIEDFARELGGASVASGSSRILVSVPGENFPEFLRRVSVLTGAALPAIEKPGLVAIELFGQDAAPPP